MINTIDILKILMNNMPWPIWIEDLEKNIIYLNDKYESEFGVRLESVLGKRNTSIFNKELIKIYNEKIKIKMSEENVCVVKENIDGNNMMFYIIPIKDEENYIQAFGMIIIDIGKIDENEINIKKQSTILRTIIDSLPESVFYKDKESRFIGINKKFKEFYNNNGIYDIIGKSDLEIYPDNKIAAEFVKIDKEIMETRETKYYEQTVKDEFNNEIIEENVKIPVISDDGEVWGIVGLSRDITERKQLEKKLRYLSENDMLTGLYNRYSFEEKIQELNVSENLPLGIIMGDVNGLKLVNDTLGHLEGDKLLISVANVLREICSEFTKYIFRWGGDEFIILLPNAGETQCEEIINKINNKCEEIDHEFIQLNIALGEAIKVTLEEDIYNCIKKVEEKVYRTKLLEKKSIKSSIINSLKKSLQEKSFETNEHTERVSKYAKAIGKKMNLKKDELDELMLTAQLHDIGKIGIDEQILMKPGKLTIDEFEIMKTHAEKGYRIINASSDLDTIAKYVLGHHEKWDGSGYPLGLKGVEIPLISRIINVVDSYDVMTNNRPYKKAMAQKEALYELERCSGTQFDPKIVNIFKEYMKCDFFRV